MQVSSTVTEAIQKMKSVRRSFSSSALFLAFACMMLGVMSSQTARAQGAPIGYWANAAKVNTLVVEQNGTCGFTNKGKVLYSGTCRWQASARGGILDLQYPMPLKPGHIRWSIVYINQTTITVAGEKFFKQAQ
jgi:hypothetical protein